ncbi:hypothetical protein [Enterococcus faecalis]
MNEIIGLEETLKNMETKLGAARVNRIANKALRKQGERNKQIVKKYMASYMDSGKTHDLVITSGIKSNPKRVETGWASKERAPIVHLNEFGYTRHGTYVRPRGMGKLQAAADEIQAKAFKEMKSDMEELAK